MWALEASGPRSSICAGGPSLFGPASTTRSFRVSAEPSNVRPIGGQGAVASIRDVLDAVEGGAQRVLAVAACGQMHGTVLIDAGGELALDSVQLWNDKRATAQVSAFAAANDVDALWPLTANPPSVAWPGFKLQWIARHQPEALARAATLLMPKDYINFRLTSRRAMDESDASCTYLFDARANAWSPLLARRLGVDPELLPPVHHASEVIGVVTPEAAGRNRAPLWHAGRRGHERFRCDATGIRRLERASWLRHHRHFDADHRLCAATP